jgi:hypothetical protein
MWIFSRHGFYSITQPKTGPNGASPDRYLQIRARIRQHLEELRTLVPALRRRRIIETPEADYRFRLVVPRTVGLKVIAVLSYSIDYSNFKDQIKDRQYHGAALAVWHTMFRLQESADPR